MLICLSSTVSYTIHSAVLNNGSVTACDCSVMIWDIDFLHRFRNNWNEKLNIYAEVMHMHKIIVNNCILNHKLMHTLTNNKNIELNSTKKNKPRWGLS